MPTVEKDCCRKLFLLLCFHSHPGEGKGQSVSGRDLFIQGTFSYSRYQRHEGGVVPTKSVCDPGEKVDGDTKAAVVTKQCKRLALVGRLGRGPEALTTCSSQRYHTVSSERQM